MSRIGITFDDVAQAALAIEQNGETPTIDKVRLFLGGTGSNTTISKYLQQWRNNVIHDGFSKENKTPTPDIVKLAVDRVWDEIREQADKEIETVRAQAQTQVATAEKQAELAEYNLKELQDKFDQLHAVHIAQSAEKELLQLDHKTLREEHHLLQERYKAFEERYAEMQLLTTQHLKDLASTHQNEIQRLEEASKTHLEAHTNLVHTMKDQHEKERQQHIVVIDSFKIEAKKAKEIIEKLQLQIQEKISDIKKLEKDVSIITVERDNLLNQIEEHDKKWSYFNDKTLISNDILSKIYDAPKFECLIEKINVLFESAVEKKFLELKEDMTNIYSFINEQQGT